MATTSEIRAIIKILVEGGHIPKEVAAQLKIVGDTSKKTQAELSGVGRSAKELGGILTQYLGAAALGAFIKSSVTYFADLGRQIATLGEVIKRFGGTEADLGKVMEALHGLALNGGALLHETVPAMQKFIGIANGNIPEAYAAIKLASDAAETGQVDFATALSGVTAIIQGKARLAANVFGLALRDASGHVKTNNELLDEAIKKYSGVSQGLNDTRENLDKTAAQWEDLKQSVGAAFAFLAKWGSTGLRNVVSGFKDAGDALGLLANGTIAVFRDMARGFAAVFDFKTLFSDPAKYAAGIKAAFAANLSDLKDVWTVYQEGLAANRKTADAKELDNAKGTADLIKQAKLASLEETRAAEAEAAKKRLEIEHKAAQESLQAQIAAATEGSHARLSLEMDLLDEQERQAVEAAKSTGANVDKIRSGFEMQRLMKGREFTEKRAAEEKSAQDRLLQLQIDGAKEGSDAKFALEMDAINRRYIAEIAAAEAIGKDTTTLKLQYEQEVTNKTLQYVADRNAKELELAQNLADARLEVEDAFLAQRVELSDANSTEWYAAQLEQLNLHFESERLALENKIAAEAELEAAGDADAVRRKAALVQELIALETSNGTATKRLVKSESDYKQEQYLAAARTAVGALQMAFGKHKALALAMITLDTALAVMEIWATHDGSPWYVKLAKTLAVAAIAEQQRQAVNSAGSGGGGSASQSSGSSTGGGVHAADGAIVPASAAMPDHPGKPSGTDTVPAWVAPGEIIAPAAPSADVLSGDAVLMAPGAVPKGVKSETIIGGRLAVVPTEALEAKAPMRAAAGAILSHSRGPSRGAPDTPEEARDRRDQAVRMAQLASAKLRGLGATAPSGGRQIGGVKFSASLLPILGAGLGTASSAAIRPAESPMLAKIADELGEIKAATQASASTEPANVDNSIHFHQPVYGGDEGGRQLVRQIDQWRRRDSNRLIK